MMMRTHAQIGIDFSSVLSALWLADAPTASFDTFCASAYSCRGPWGGLEISASISPTDLSFASSATSAYANEPILVVHDRQAPHLMLCHQLKRVRKIVIGPHRNELARRDLPSRHTSRILPFGDRPNDDVAIGDHPRELLPVEDGNRAYVFSRHQLGDLT